MPWASATSPASPSGRKGTKWENALAVSDNGANDLGNRRIANGAEKLWIVTEKGQDAGFPDKEGIGFVSNKRFGWRGLPRHHGRPAVSAALHRRQAVRAENAALPLPAPRRRRARRAADRRQPESERLHQPGAGVGHQQPDRRDRLERKGFGADNDLFGAVYGILDTGPESLVPTWPAVLRIEFLEPDRRKMVVLRPKHRARARTPTRSRRIGAAWSGRTTLCSAMTGRQCISLITAKCTLTSPRASPFYTVPKSGVIWAITHKGA